MPAGSVAAVRRLAALAAVVALGAVAPTASAAPPNPFGHACTPQNGVLFCPTVELSERVPTWDGVPQDVDVTLPAEGDGPFPTIVMIHGLGEDKTRFESNDPNPPRYSNVALARRGYAVVNPSLRGWGRSCGKPESRTPGDCDKGWTHLDDHAYEARDVQNLVGALVDQGVTASQAIGITGASLGGGLTNSLAYLRDRVMTPDGALVPWTSPNGTPLSVAAAWSRWGWSDLAYSLAPNGRWLESRDWKSDQALDPPGVEKLNFVNAFYLIAGLNFRAPPGADLNSDLAGAREISDKGEPYPQALLSFFTQLSESKSASGLFGSVPAPLLVQDGWTDDIFTPQEALRIYRDTPVALQFGDLGHGRASNKPNESQVFQSQGEAFFDAHLKRVGTAPAAGSVTAFTQTCPKSTPSGGPFRAASWAKIHPGAFRFSGAKAQKVTSTGGDPAASKAFDQIASGDPCVRVSGRGRGTAVYKAKVRKGFTMIGLPLIKATVAAKGRFGQLAAHLYDVSDGKRTLVTRGTYRLEPNQKGKIALQLNGNGWTFARGHTVMLQLMGRDPNFMRPSNGKFTVKVSQLTTSLPTRERKPR